jgi:hypothetical protein
MEQSAGQAQASVFAADGGTRHRVVRAAVVAGLALLVAWLIALALGVLGGFGSLPLLPSSHPKSSTEASSSAQHAVSAAPAAQPQHQAAPIQTGAPPWSGTKRSASRTSARVTPAPRAKPIHPIQSNKSTSPTTINGHAYGGTRPSGSGKPLGSPGNGTGGSGAPGQLR